MKDSDELKFKESTCCHICKAVYTEDDVKVKDYCQVNSSFKGSAHESCSLIMKVYADKLKLPVVFHNLHGYDSHLIMQRISDIVKKHSYKDKKGNLVDLAITATPTNMEKYLCFELGRNLKFIDSMKFLGTSLEKLVDNVTGCGRCKACKPDPCKRKVEYDGNMNQHITSFPFSSCVNCNSLGKPCINPNYNLLKYTSEVFKGKGLSVMSR